MAWGRSKQLYIYKFTDLGGCARLFVTFPDSMLYGLGKTMETTSEYQNMMRERVTVLIDLKGLMKGCGLKVIEIYIDVLMWMDISVFGK